MPKITITEFTDPVCSWCWGSEPALRALSYHYQGDIAIRYVMGGLYEDIRSQAAENPADFEAINAGIFQQWVEDSEIHEMPISPTGISLFTEASPSSLPQNIAYEAAKLASPWRADRFLRLLREATFIDGETTGEEETLLSIARRAELSIPAFLRVLKNGEAEEAFYVNDRGLKRKYCAVGFPAFLVQVKDSEIMLRGYQMVETFYSVIEFLSYQGLRQPLVEVSQETILAFIRQFGEVFPAEIKTAFFLSNEMLRAYLVALSQRNLIEMERAGTSLRIRERAGASRETAGVAAENIVVLEQFS